MMESEVEGVVSFENWSKLKLRVGQILEVANVENADRLYKLKISLGDEERTLVAGLKEFYEKEELKNKIVIIFTNLEPRKIKGIESKGMLLASVETDEDGNAKKVALLQPDKEISLGSRIS
jgi:methionyl-tRNA synthetase